MGLNLPTANAIDTQIKRAFDAFGLSVKVGTQRILIYAIKELNGNSPSPACIWKAVRNLDIQDRRLLAQCPQLREPRELPSMRRNRINAPHPPRMREINSNRDRMESSQHTLESKRRVMAHNKIRHYTGKNRLFNIIVTESAHLLWKLRCERTIKFDNDATKTSSEERPLTKNWSSVHGVELSITRKICRITGAGSQGF